MSIFTLAISCLTTSNLPWFMDLTFQIPMQYCSLQHQTLFLITSYTHNWVLFLLWLHPFILSGVISPLISSSILGTYWPGESSFSILSFCLFILFMGFSRQEYWSGFPFPSPVDHILQWTGSNHSILKEISSEYSLEGLMLRLKLLYFDHLMQRTDSLEDPDAWKDRRCEEKGTTEDQMVGWHHQLNGYEFE